MQIQDLKNYVAIVDAGSILKASEQLYTAQSTLSRRLALLESKLGYTLLQRSTHSLVMTPHGRVFYDYAKILLADYMHMLSALDHCVPDTAEHLTIGYNPISGQPPFLIRTLQALAEAYPNIYAEIRCLYSPDLNTALEDGRLDCALISTWYLNNPALFETEPLHPIHYYALLPAAHRLAKRSSVRIQDLVKEQILLIDQVRSPAIYRLIQGIRERENLPLQIQEAANSLESLLILIRSGKGIGIVTSASHGSKKGDIAAVRIEGIGKNVLRVLAWRKDNLKPGIRMLLDVLRQEVRKDQED